MCQALAYGVFHLYLRFDTVTWLIICLQCDGLRPVCTGCHQNKKVCCYPVNAESSKANLMWEIEKLQYKCQDILKRSNRIEETYAARSSPKLTRPLHNAGETLEYANQNRAPWKKPIDTLGLPRKQPKASHSKLRNRIIELENKEFLHPTNTKSITKPNDQVSNPARTLSEPHDYFPARQKGWPDLSLPSLSTFDNGSEWNKGSPHRICKYEARFVQIVWDA